jgi:hypothetical protein
MAASLHKRILIISIVFAIIVLGASIIAFLHGMDLINVIGFGSLLLCFPIIAIFSSYAIIRQDWIWIKKSARYSLILYPVFLILTIPEVMSTENIPLIITLAVLLFIPTILALMHIFLYTDPTSLTGTIIFIVLIIISLVIKRLHLVGSSVAITLSVTLFAMGSFMYGIRCLFLAERISYLKLTSFFGSCLITASFVGMMFKLQHWPGAGFLLIISTYSILLFTIIVIFTLPSSGFLDWQPLHKKILRRLLFPWVFLFLLFLMQTLLPELNNIIWNPGSRPNAVGFEMFDYTPDNKDGLHQE